MIAGKRVLGLLPARGGSKGLPGKNLLKVGGRPLIDWTINAARKSRYIDRLVLSSDDEGIIAAAEKAGCEAPFIRDAILATDVASSLDVVYDTLQRVPGYDVVVLLQPTSPLRDTTDIDGALELLMSSGAPTCVSLGPASEHPYWIFQREPSGSLIPFASPPDGLPVRRQDLPQALSLNGAVYVAHVPWFQVNRKFLCKDAVGYVMPAIRSLDIDTPEDMALLKGIVEGSRLP